MMTLILRVHLIQKLYAKIILENEFVTNKNCHFFLFCNVIVAIERTPSSVELPPMNPLA